MTYPTFSIGYLGGWLCHVVEEASERHDRPFAGGERAKRIQSGERIEHAVGVDGYVPLRVMNGVLRSALHPDELGDRLEGRARVDAVVRSRTKTCPRRGKHELGGESMAHAPSGKVGA